METVYYHLDAWRVQPGELASGGEGGSGVRYALVPRAGRPSARAAGGDNVLDFAACRRALLEREQAFCPPQVPTGRTAREGDGEPEQGETSGRARSAAPEGGPRHRWLWPALEACATVSVVVLCLVVSLQFLRIL